MSAKADLPVPSEVPATIKATIRGVTYTISELSMDRYDELLKKATTKVRNDITGEDEETTDQRTLMRLMINEAVTPKPESVMKLGVRHYRALTGLISDLHYGDEPVKIEPDADEETPGGNGVA